MGGLNPDRLILGQSPLENLQRSEVDIATQFQVGLDKLTNPAIFEHLCPDDLFHRQYRSL
jgi:hypothetical protein